MRRVRAARVVIIIPAFRVGVRERVGRVVGIFEGMLGFGGLFCFDGLGVWLLDLLFFLVELNVRVSDYIGIYWSGYAGMVIYRS